MASNFSNDTDANGLRAHTFSNNTLGNKDTTEEQASNNIQTLVSVFLKSKIYGLYYFSHLCKIFKRELFYISS